jgi:hypothetical protein
VKFVKSTSYNVVNLARVDPALLKLSLAADDIYQRQYITLKTETKPVTCIMVGTLMEDYTDHPQQWRKRDNHYDKNISIVPITLEAERYIAAMCVVLKKDSFRATGNGTQLKISTKPGSLPYKCEFEQSY